MGAGPRFVGRGAVVEMGCREHGLEVVPAREVRLGVLVVMGWRRQVGPKPGLKSSRSKRNPRGPEAAAPPT